MRLLSNKPIALLKLGSIIAILLGWQVILDRSLLAQNSNLQGEDLRSVRSTLKVCPAEVQTLTNLLLRDLPSYANRVTRRSRSIGSNKESSLYIVVAGKAEFAPLSLGPGEYTSIDLATDPEAPQQVFFTTLERRYTDGKIAEFQHYHWIFLANTKSGWKLVTMYSRLGSSTGDKPPTPPRETSNGIIGQAVRIWLRDCQAGTLRA
jgi:hypothetical protein